VNAVDVRSRISLSRLRERVGVRAIAGRIPPPHVMIGATLTLPSPASGRGFRRRAAAALAALFLCLLAFPAAAVTVERVVSPGGIEAWLVEDHTLPVVSLEIAFAGGASADPAGKSGLANMTASLLDEGAGDLDSQAFQRREEDLASSLRFAASQDNLSVAVRALTQNVAPTLDLVRLALTRPRFDPEPVERMRSQLVVSLARKSESPQSIASRIWWRNAFGDHPYARPSDGTPETVQAVTLDDLKRVVRERIARDVMTIGVTGDVAAAELATLLDKTFGALPAKAAPLAVPETTANASGSVLLVKKPIPQSVVTFGQAGIKRDDPDWYAALVMNHVLGGGGFTARLTTEVREKRGLAYGVYSYLAPLKHAGVVLGGVATENGKIAQSLELIRAEWRRMRLQPDALSFVVVGAPANLPGAREVSADGS